MGHINKGENLVEIIFLTTAAAFFMLLLVLSIVNTLKIKKINRKYKKLMTSDSCNNLEEIINTCIEKSERIEQENVEIRNMLHDNEEKILGCIQKFSVVRYNAFDHTGSNLSYSIALLDAGDSGVVLTSIYSRESSTAYSKPIVNGKSKYPLSVEEVKAINDAIRRSRK